MAVAAPSLRNESLLRRFDLRKICVYLVMVAVALVILFPIYWMLTISIKIPRDIYRTA